MQSASLEAEQLYIDRASGEMLGSLTHSTIKTIFFWCYCAFLEMKWILFKMLSLGKNIFRKKMHSKKITPPASYRSWPDPKKRKRWSFFSSQSCSRKACFSYFIGQNVGSHSGETTFIFKSVELNTLV